MVAHTHRAVGSVTGQCDTLTASHRACQMHISAACAGKKSCGCDYKHLPSCLNALY